MLENVIERSSKAWGVGQKSKFCFSPARGAHFSIKCGQNPNVKFRPQGVILLGGGGLGHVGAIFCSWALLDFFWMLLLIFFNFLSISNGFWEDLGRVLVDFGKV